MVRRPLVDVLIERCAGIDIGKDEVVACVRTPAASGRGRRKRTRTFAAFTGSLEAMADWFAAEGVTEIAMEATGSYWKPVWYVLEERAFALKLVTAHHVKILPGRKSDVLDAEWLAELLEHGLLRASFEPPPAIRELRDLTRYRKRLIQAHTSECQRIQKTLEDAGIKLDSVASDVLACPGGRCSPPWSPASATPRCWPSWPRAGCGAGSPRCGRPCAGGAANTTRS